MNHMASQAAQLNPACTRQRVIVALSGGVDSAVAALMLQQAGCEVEGLFVMCWPSNDPFCRADLDFQAASEVAKDLAIELHRISLVDAYRTHVFEPFLSGLHQGLTPNPDLLCNQVIKFGLLKEYAMRLGARWFATGHHARLAQGPDGLQYLLRGGDPVKDQSYFLATLGQEALRQVLFPIGHLSKGQVRAIAANHGLRNHDRPGTAGLCLVGPRRFGEFVEAHLTMEPGPIHTWEGHVLAQRHLGLARYTIGQRTGLGLGALKGIGSGPWFVADKRPAANVLVVASGEHHPALYHDVALCREPHWIGRPPPLPSMLMAKTRYRQADQPCVVHDRPEDGGLAVHFMQSQRALTPGQAIVFYMGGVCLGAATVHRSFSAASPGDVHSPLSVNRRPYGDIDLEIT
jgi:tRNA-specific 2-thiouridylase